MVPLVESGAWLLVLAILFLISSAIFMGSWNYVVPRLAASADSTYDRGTRFTDIDYPTAMVAVILISLFFSPTNITLSSPQYVIDKCSRKKPS